MNASTTRSAIVVAAAIMLSLASPTRRTVAEDAKELDSYSLVADAFVSRPSDAKDVVYYSDTPDGLAKRLKELGQTFPDNMKFPTGGLFILVVSDNVNEAFASVSAVASKHEVVVDLSKDADAKPAKADDDKHKTSRMLLIWCPPMKVVKSISIKTADGKVHAAKTVKEKANANQ